MRETVRNRDKEIEPKREKKIYKKWRDRDI